MDDPDAAYNPIADDDPESAESALNYHTSASLVPTSPATTASSLNPRPNRHRSRSTVVCAECKRLKIGCDKRRPCGKCIDRRSEHKCIYDPAADGRVDVHTVRNAQLADRNLTYGMADLLCITPDDRATVLEARQWPPSDDFEFNIDTARLRARLGLDEHPHNSGIQEYQYPPDPVHLVAFSAPPQSSSSSSSSAPSPSPGGVNRLGHTPAPVTPARRRFTAGKSQVGTSAMGGAVAKAMLDQASRVFQCASTTVPTDSTSHFGLYASVFGWEVKVAHCAGASIAMKEDEDGDEEEEQGERRDVVAVAPGYSEMDFLDRARPKDGASIRLAESLFFSSSASASNPPSSIPSSSQSPPPHPPHQQNPLAFLSPPPPPPRPSPSPLFAPLLVTPKMVKQHLPSTAFRALLWGEFEEVMEIYDGMGGSGKLTWIRKRVDQMCQWAEYECAENGGDGVSTYTSSSHSSGSGMGLGMFKKGKLSRAPSDYAGSDPPTLALFAVACHVFAMGALHYECKRAHGIASPHHPESSAMEVDASGSGSSSRAMPPPSLIPTAMDVDHQQPQKKYAPPPPRDLRPLPTPYTAHALHTLGTASLLTHDQHDLPPSLDYVYAYILRWTYLLHPSDSLSRTNHSGHGNVRGVAGGNVAQVDRNVWKELGAVVNVARVMGLGVVDEVGSGGAGGGMGLWEREMRRRVWWQLVLMDTSISESMGQPPLINLNPASCKPPTDLDDSCFDPTSESFPPPAIGGPVETRIAGANTTYFAYRCRLYILKARARLLPPNNLTAAQAMEDQITRWLKSLPDAYTITILDTPNDTHFPSDPTVAVQACALYAEAALCVIKLYYPFLSQPQTNRSVLLACATSARAVVITLHHMLTRFRASKTLLFGHYGFGRAVWLASTLLTSCVAADPAAIWAGACRSAMDLALEVVGDAVVSGLADGKPVTVSGVQRTLGHLVHQVDSVRSRGRGGGKRKESGEGETGDVVKARRGKQIPYVGVGLENCSAELEFGLSPRRTPVPVVAAKMSAVMGALRLDGGGERMRERERERTGSTVMPQHQHHHQQYPQQTSQHRPTPPPPPQQQPNPNQSSNSNVGSSTSTARQLHPHPHHQSAPAPSASSSSQSQPPGSSFTQPRSRASSVSGMNTPESSIAPSAASSSQHPGGRQKPIIGIRQRKPGKSGSGSGSGTGRADSEPKKVKRRVSGAIDREPSPSSSSRRVASVPSPIPSSVVQGQIPIPMPLTQPNAQGHAQYPHQYQPPPPSQYGPGPYPIPEQQQHGVPHQQPQPHAHPIRYASDPGTQFHSLHHQQQQYAPDQLMTATTTTTTTPQPTVETFTPPPLPPPAQQQQYVPPPPQQTYTHTPVQSPHAYAPYVALPEQPSPVSSDSGLLNTTSYSPNPNPPNHFYHPPQYAANLGGPGAGGGGAIASQWESEQPVPGAVYAHGQQWPPPQAGMYVPQQPQPQQYPQQQQPPGPPY